MVEVTFTPTIETVIRMNGMSNIDFIEKETMLFSASPEFALQMGGPLTQQVVRELMPHLEKEELTGIGQHWVIDTRSHMLMPGMYPAIGGWHCDAVPRAEYGSQPDIKQMDDSPHYTITMSTDENGVSRTEFITDELTLDIDPENVWKSCSKQIEEQNLGKRILVPDGHLTRFTSSTLHRASMANRRGWRWFLRCSAYYGRPYNRIRHQVQVYTDIQSGW